jgi:hypothetical protein
VAGSENLAGKTVKGSESVGRSAQQTVEQVKEKLMELTRED